MNAVLGPGSVFEGKLTFTGQARIDGSFGGGVTTDDLLIIGEGAKVDADIRCGSLVVEGEVTGTVTARDAIELAPHARVKAGLTTPALTMAKGAVFDGSCKMNGAAPDLVSISRHDDGENAQNARSRPARKRSWQHSPKGADRHEEDTTTFD
ncbi:MAG: hypothetical protein AUG02_00120 [Chloroflexi bacterium 13_1_20CM_2_70_9]|nr:MAG: hypothetical protein AUG02_00120 [Chloroflexi bacterium 13_1_20CM_2_70_9]